MIARLWHGWAQAAGADAYEHYFRETLAPELRNIPGFCGAHLLRRADGDDVELVTMTCFDSLDAVRRFAGDTYEHAVVSPYAQTLLTRYDRRCQHFDLAVRLPGAGHEG
jgi:antibiotic biosynthesis monooxygenase (ABM) superfamily enzyme